MNLKDKLMLKAELQKELSSKEPFFDTMFSELERELEKRAPKLEKMLKDLEL